MTFLRNIFQSGKNSKLLIAENPVQHKTFKLHNSNNKIDREWWCRLAPSSLKATRGEREKVKLCKLMIKRAEIGAGRGNHQIKAPMSQKKKRNDGGGAPALTFAQ